MQLFNLDDDPLEANPVDNKKLISELSSSLMLHLQKAGQVPWQKAE
jgi:hypothetical protein